MKSFEEFKIINELLAQLNITYWLDFGCALKWHRDKQLDESDIDFGIMIDDYDKLKEVIEQNKDKFEKINYRTREISLRFNGVKFDFICFVKKDNDIYFYAYKQNQYNNNKWNYEWRGRFPYDVYFPLKSTHIFDTVVPIPNNIEKKIEMQYGLDWRTPKPHIACWTYELNQVKDINYRPVAVIMTTIERDEILFKVLPSYLQYPVKLYLLDQGKHTKEKDEYYDKLRNEGHDITYAGDIGLSTARNYLLNKAKDEEYIFMTEDDIELKTNPYSLLNKFTNNNLGILGGLLIRNGKEQHYEFALELNNGTLNYVKKDTIDLCLNFFLAKRKVFEDIQYDEQLKLCEHTHFFMQLKKINKWKVDYTRNLEGIHHTFKPENYMTYRSRAEQYTEVFKKKWGITKINKNTEKTNKKSDLTVFVLTHDDEPNYNLCIEALKNQTIDFKLDIIRNFHPMSAAFQEMLNRCNTPHYIQVDSDMILNKDAIEKLYKAIISSDEKTAMICYKLHDSHLDKAIDGIKIYKYDIFKNYPYNNVMSCEMEQLGKLEKDGYKYTRIAEVIGTHCPMWTKETIFERYFNYMEKLKKFQSPNYSHLLKTLLSIFLKEPNKNNLYAFIGALSSSILPKNKIDEKDYTVPLLSKFALLDKTFDDYQFNKEEIQSKPPEIIINNKPLVLQIAGIPCANRPYDINQLINAYSSKYTSRHVLGGQYSKKYADIPYREFPYDLLLKLDKEKIHDLINEAKIIHIHHRIDQSLLRLIPNDKKIIFTVSNLGSSLKINNTPQNIEYDNNIKKITNIITVTDQPLQKIAYEYLTTKSLPLVKFLFNKANIKHNIKPIVVFAPTNRKSEEATSKGYFRVLGIIYKLKLDGLDFDFDLIEGVPYEENLKRKQVADILIDDVVNENYHNSSIEAGCFGAAVLTNYSDSNYPFIKTNLSELENNLKNLIIQPETLKKAQSEMITWANTIYTPEKILLPFEQLYDEVLSNSYKVNNIEPLIIENKNPMDILKLLQNNHIPFCLLEKSCLEAVKYKNLTSKLSIGVDNEVIKQEVDALCGDNVSITIKKIQTKKIIINGEFVNVPVPVVPYLTKLYGNWRTL
jgi:hypothetical protein